MTPDGRSLDYRLERDPTTDEIRELTTWWLRMAEGHLIMVNHFLYEETRRRYRPTYYWDLLGREAQWGLEWSFKGLLAVDNDTLRFRRDAALMWRHVQSARPIADREGALAMESLLAATTGPDGLGCSLAAFTEAYLRDEPLPELSEREWEAVRFHLPTAVGSLITEALARSGAVREDLRRERRSGGDTG